MEDYIVSARKYRPATFDTVVGQRALTVTLLNAIRTGKLAHAYLFCGPRGVGKTTCARIFARTINCQSPRPDGEACGQCESCRSFDRGVSMNIHELDAASNNSVDDIRELIEQVRIPPQGGKCKVFIIDEVHMLSAAAFNAFLKTLEEPPAHVVFVLATTEKHKILPTILSRCQVYDFQRMTVQNTVDHLAYVAEKEGYTADPEALNLIARKADGGMRDALSMFDQMASFTGGAITLQSALDHLNALDQEYYFRAVDHVLAGQVEQCLLLLDEVLGKGFDPANFMAGMAAHMRDLLVARDPSTLPLLQASDSERQRYAEQAARCTPRFIFTALRLCNDCDNGMRQSRNKRLQAELCLIQAAQLNQPDEPSSGPRPEEKIKPISKPQPAASEPAQRKAEPTVQKPTFTLTPTKKKVPDLNTVCINERPAEYHTKAEKKAEADFHVSDRGRLTEDNMLLCWQQYATHIGATDNATGTRLRGLQPQYAADGQFSITVGSAMLRDSLLERKADIEAFFTRHVGAAVAMDVKQMAVEQAQQAFSKPHILQRLMTENPALRQLVDTMELEIV